eukprot:2890719-Rhodomonas_salina.4
MPHTPDLRIQDHTVTRTAQLEQGRGMPTQDQIRERGMDMPAEEGKERSNRRMRERAALPGSSG